MLKSIKRKICCSKSRHNWTDEIWQSSCKDCGITLDEYTASRPHSVFLHGLDLD